MRHPEHVRVRRWTRREYERMIDRGIFRPDDRLELLDGQLVVKEPQDSDHFTALLLVADTLRAAFGPGCGVRRRRARAPARRTDGPYPRRRPAALVCRVEGRRGTPSRPWPRR